MAKIFCTDPCLQEFHGIFLSCNEPVDATRWCSRCEKCAFVFLLMSAFLPPPCVRGVFGDDLFQKECLTDTFKALVGKADDGKEMKPFECVGTITETKAAVELACRQCARYAASHRGRMPLLPPILDDLSKAVGLTVQPAPGDEGQGRRHVEDVVGDEDEEVVFKRVTDRWLESEKMLGVHCLNS